MNFKNYLEEEAYKDFFAKMLKKYGVKSPAELSDEEKKKFFDEVDAGWESKKEEALKEGYAKSMGFTTTAEKIRSLTKILSPKSRLCKAISKDADNVEPEFKQMKRLIDEIEEIWEEIEYNVDMSNEEL